jgi:hypothetical protein
MTSLSTTVEKIDNLPALVERLNSGDESVYVEIAELLTRSGFTLRAAFTGTPPPGFLAAYVRGDLALRQDGPVARALGLVPRSARKAASTRRASRPKPRLVTREKDGHRISVDSGLLRQLERLNQRQAEEGH